MAKVFSFSKRVRLNYCTTHHDPPPPTTSQNITTTTHYHPSPSTITHHQPKYIEPKYKHLYQSLFFDKVAGLRLATLLKKRLWRSCFPVNFAKFLRTPSLQNTSWRLLLYILRYLRFSLKFIFHEFKVARFILFVFINKIVILT